MGNWMILGCEGKNEQKWKIFLSPVKWWCLHTWNTAAQPLECAPQILLEGKIYFKEHTLQTVSGAVPWSHLSIHVEATLYPDCSQPMTEYIGGSKDATSLPKRGLLWQAIFSLGLPINLLKGFSEMHYILKLCPPHPPSLSPFTGVRYHTHILLLSFFLYGYFSQ